MNSRAAVAEAWAVAALPWTFAGAGLALGAAALVTEQPLPAACGAVAGVAAGLVERHRAGTAERRAEALRTRLREQRAEAEENASELRREVRDLRNQLWQRDLDAVVAAGAAYVPVLERPEEPTTGELLAITGPPSGPIAQVIDLRAREDEPTPAIGAEDETPDEAAEAS